MASSAVRTWRCAQCGRVVPSREPRCHCGLERSVNERMAARAARPPAVIRPRSAWPLVVIGGIFFAIAGLALFALTRPPARLATDIAGGPPPRGAVYPELPAITPPPRTAAAVPAIVRTPAAASANATAVRALDPLLRAIAQDAAALESAYAPFAAECLRGGARESRAGDWRRTLAEVEIAPREGDDVGLSRCRAQWTGLMAGLDAVQAQLRSARDQARTLQVPPALWRQHLEMYGLQGWIDE